jgi:2,3-bisphosphoglycerate-dependent phosphoglycerate mutase
MIEYMGKLVLLRHGKSTWNLKNIFTGWVDVPLCFAGVEEALYAGELLKAYCFDAIFTSTLCRAQTTAYLAMTKSSDPRTPCIVSDLSGDNEGWSDVSSDVDQIPVYRSQALNERMYGKLQGMNKDRARAEFGDAQVHIWRRSYDVPPPDGESLEMTCQRTIPYFEKEILPRVKTGGSILVAAHGNSLRSIVKDIEKLSPEEILNLEIATGVPIVYEWQDSGWSKSVLS